MAAKGGEVKLHLDHVTMKVAAASDAALEAVALQIEAQTKANIQRNGQIDTGFMMNSTYTATRKRSTYDHANPTGVYTNRQGETVRRAMASEQTLPENASAACAVGADYAIWQEEQKPFLYPAAETVAGQVKGTVEQVFKKELK